MKSGSFDISTGSTGSRTRSPSKAVIDSKYHQFLMNASGVESQDQSMFSRTTTSPTSHMFDRSTGSTKSQTRRSSESIIDPKYHEFLMNVSVNRNTELTEHREVRSLP